MCAIAQISDRELAQTLPPHRHIGAELCVDSARGRGTVLKVSLPLPEPAAATVAAQMREA